MRVGLNLIYLVPGETGGTETYARELVPELLRAAPEAQFTAFINRETASAPDDLVPWRASLDSVALPIEARRRLQWVRGEQLMLPRAAERRDVEVLHSLANTAPAFGRYRRVVTIHDLHHRLVPEAHLGPLGLGMRLLVPAAAHRATRVLTPSEATRADLVRLLGVDAGLVDTVPEGVSVERQAQATGGESLRRRLDAGERPIVLSVSAKRPHKNLARLIGAIGRIPAAERPLLVVPGYPTAYEAALRRLVREQGLERDVRLLGWISPPDLEGLYATASCLACVSLHEGFGLPVLEAMARGLAVCCSDRGALGEVAGGAAVTVDPVSEEAIAAGILAVLRDGELRERLVRDGRARAKGFTWEATARGTIASYERALAA